MPLNAGNFDDKFFGPLTWEEKHEWFSGKIKFANDKSVEVKLVPKSTEEMKLFAREAEEIFSMLKQKFGEIYSEMRDEYLKLYNKSWSQVVNGYGEPVGHGEISGEQFDDFISLESIWFESDGSVELFFYDGDELFGGHSIHVWLDDRLNVRRTGLEG